MAATTVSEWGERAKLALAFIDGLGEKPGRLAVAILGVILLLYTGVLPSAATLLRGDVADLKRELGAHDTKDQAAVAARSVTDARLNDTLLRLADVIEKRARRDRLRECAEIKDLQLRTQCLAIE